MRKRFQEHSSDPVIEALRQRLRRRGLLRVAEDLGISVSYTEALAYGKRSMTLHVAGILGFERQVIWRSVQKPDQFSKYARPK